MRPLGDLSIKKKLIAIIMLTSSVALLLACSAFAFYELSLFRTNLSREQNSIAQIVSDSSTAALTFEDRGAAEEVLAALRGEPRIAAAAIYSRDGRLFASYVRRGRQDNFPEASSAQGASFEDGHLVRFHDVMLDGKRIGTVYLKTELAEMYERLAQYVGIALGVLATSLLAAFLVSSILQKFISHPVLRLAETAREVSTNANYSLRAAKDYDDEVGLLVDRFNDMMEQIHSRDVALQRAQDELEERVEDRTRELREEIDARERTQKELLAAKEAAEEANRAKSVFLANMSHELRTPLNAVIGYAELLEEEAEEAGQEESVADLQKIHKAGRHLLTLINDILDLSKIEAGRMDIHLEDASVKEIIDQAVMTVEPLARRNGNRLSVECEDWGTVKVDIVRFRQSLLNLMSNACKFTENGTITLAVERETRDGREWVDWHIRDTGIGIAEEDRHKLFRAFSQVDSSATRRHGGTGLGLVISQRLCSMMGGRIVVDSVPGHGSTFTIQLPADSDGHAEHPDGVDGADARSEEQSCLYAASLVRASECMKISRPAGADGDG